MEHNLNSQAWLLLTEDEQLSINLSIVNNFSTLKAGEVMGKAHYKYLEILARSKVFLKIFNEHLSVYNEVLPQDLSISDDLREYFEYTIVQRKTIKEASALIRNRAWHYKANREAYITKGMITLNRSFKQHNKDAFLLIKEFDRWNNFRILPYEVQDPSAFKRRNKNVHIKTIKHIMNIHPFSAKVIIQRYGTNPNSDKTKIVYFCMFSKEYPEKVVKMRVRNYTRDGKLFKLGKLGIYVFRREEDAIKYISLVEDYMGKDRSCRYGQKFWPTYRDHIKKALNYNMIFKAIPSRKHFENALVDIDGRLAINK